MGGVWVIVLHRVGNCSRDLELVFLHKRRMWDHGSTGSLLIFGYRDVGLLKDYVRG